MINYLYEETRKYRVDNLMLHISKMSEYKFHSAGLVKLKIFPATGLEQNKEIFSLNGVRVGYYISDNTQRLTIEYNNCITIYSTDTFKQISYHQNGRNFNEKVNCYTYE